MFDIPKYFMHYTPVFTRDGLSVSGEFFFERVRIWSLKISQWENKAGPKNRSQIDTHQCGVGPKRVYEVILG